MNSSLSYNFGMGYQRILVAIDRSDRSETVFEAAIELAVDRGAALMIFYCLPVESPAMAPYANLYGEDLINFSQAIHEQLEKQTQEVQQWLSECGQKATARGIATEWDWKVGDAGRWICDMAETWQADLIVIGRRGLRGLAEFFLGSVSNYVIHHSRCSILVVQDSKKDK